MPILRVRQNQGHYDLSGQDLHQARVIVKAGVVMLPLLGFIEYKFSRQFRQVKLDQVLAFTPGDGWSGEWSYYGMNAVALGVYARGGVFCVLVDGLPIVWCELRNRHATEPYNVRDIGSAKVGRSQ